MELTEFFTSRVDLPSDAVDISAPTYSAAADILTELLCEYSEQLVAASMIEGIVPQVFARYQPAAGTPAEPGLTPGELYCYRNKEGLEHLFDTLIWYDSFDLGGLD